MSSAALLTLLLVASAGASPLSLEGAFQLALADVGPHKGKLRPLPDVAKPRPVEDVLERWRFESCSELQHDGKLETESASRHPYADTVLVRRSMMGSSQCRAVAFSTRDLHFLASLNQDAPTQSSPARWEELTPQEGSAGRANGAGGRPVWMIYQESHGRNGPVALVAIQSPVDPSHGGGNPSLFVQVYASDGRMAHFLAALLPDGRVRRLVFRACGDAFALKAGHAETVDRAWLLPLRFEELSSFSRAP